MKFDVETVGTVDWLELAASLHSHGYSTHQLRSALDLSDPVTEIIKNIGRYSYYYLDELTGSEEPFLVLARLFMLRGHVTARDFNTLGRRLTDLLRRTGLVTPVVDSPHLLRATAAITEIEGRLFLSDPLFENTGTRFLMHAGADRCMPPHASSLELLEVLYAPRKAYSFLDVGCGSGCQSLLFAADYGRIVGFDPGSRQVAFARANAQLNGIVATYTVERWQTFSPVERFDHIAFNTPNAETAFAFINSGMNGLLSASGHAQVFLVSQRLEGECDWEDHVLRRLTSSDGWDIRIHVHTNSPFALSARHLSEGRLPADTLLVDDPSIARAYLDELRCRRVAEVSSLTLTISRAGEFTACETEHR